MISKLKAIKQYKGNINVGAHILSKFNLGLQATGSLSISTGDEKYAYLIFTWFLVMALKFLITSC
jgi:hypothetical protein